MDKVKSFSLIIISIIIICAIGILFYSYLDSKKAYDYKGVFVTTDSIGSELNGYLPKAC